MQTVEVTGKTIEDATETAASKLGVSAEDLLVTVLDESKKLFGKSQVRIRAEKIVPEVQQEAKAEPTKVEEPVVAEEAPKPTKSKRSTKEVAVAAPKSPEPVEDSELPEEEPVEESPAGEVSNIIANEEDGEKFLEIVNKLTASAELNVTCHVSQLTGKYVTLELDGKDVAYLIGRHGEVLNAFQSLVNIIGSKKLNNGVRVTLDGNNYRQKREESLKVMATKIAEEVMVRKEEAVLDPLPAFERRIVHKHLAEMEGVTTYSEGEEPNRHIVIAPKD